MAFYTRTLLPMVLLLCSLQYVIANNGEIAYAYPISDIKIDGDLSDWPANTVRYPINRYENDAKKNRPGDASAYFMTGYDPQLQRLYVGVAMEDDDYVRTPENAFYASHDLQVLYLDLKHASPGSGVIAYELCEDNRKIVHQEQMPWYPEVA
ncbi:MAG: hypothetical protein AAGF89_07335, partial [Bacteroidota bacterium]